MEGQKIVNRTVWQIQLPLEPPHRWFTLATCDTPEATAEVVRVLLRHRTEADGELKIVPASREVICG